MATIDIEIGDLSYEISFSANIYRDEGTYDTPPNHEWEYKIESITVFGEYGDGQDVYFDRLKEEIQQEIEESIDQKISEWI